jgi:hypothetical protein
MKCFECGKDVARSDEFFIGVDRPYVNLILDSECYRKIKDGSKDYLNKYIQSRAGKISDWIVYMNGQKTNKRGKRKNNVEEKIDENYEENEDNEDNEE